LAEIVEFSLERETLACIDRLIQTISQDGSRDDAIKVLISKGLEYYEKHPEKLEALVSKERKKGKAEPIEARAKGKTRQPKRK